MVSRDRCACFVFATLAIFGRIGYFIDAPLWLDYFSGNDTSHQNHSWSNTSNPNSTDPIHRIDPAFLLFSQYLFSAVFFGAATLFCSVCMPGSITEVETTFPKAQFATIGVSQGLSSVFFNYAISGHRTPPYLQAILANFNIPIQFTVRFLILRKRPTCLKLVCAVVVALTEFVCMIPTIFPWLEDSAAHRDEEGATGAGRILYPLCMVASMVPFAVANSIMERGVQSKQQTTSGDTSRLHVMYFLFWMNLFSFLTTTCLWFVDLIPGFGTAHGIHEFGETFWFNIQCLFGGGGCTDGVVLLGWANFTLCIVNGVAFLSLMRYSEGANFVIIVLTLRTPLLFLFWTLFHENPFYWHPEAHLSTWLSVGAICVMLPAIVIYDRAPPEKTPTVRHDVPWLDDVDQNPLIDDANSTENVYYDDSDFEPINV